MRRSESGTAALEFALVVPLLLVLTLGVVQVGLIVRDDLVLAGAARAGAREAAVTSDDGRVRAAIDRSAPGLEAGSIDVSVARSGRGSPASVSLIYHERVRVPFVDWLFPAAITLRAQAAMRQEFG